MPQLKTYDIFISHAWGHHSDYYRIVNFLNGANNLKWRNYSVPKHDPKDVGTSDEDFAKKLAEALKAQMRPVNIVLILAGMYATHSDWIEFEIEFASVLNKPMIGIRPWGQERVPKIVTESVKEMVGWNTDSIVKAIRKWSI